MGVPLPDMIVLSDESFENFFPQAAFVTTKLFSIRIEIHNYEEKDTDNPSTY